MILLAMLLAIPWYSHAGHGHNSNTRVFIGGSFWFGPPPNWGPPAWGPRYYYGAPVYYGFTGGDRCATAGVYPPPQVYVQRGQTESDYCIIATTLRASTPTSSPAPADG